MSALERAEPTQAGALRAAAGLVTRLAELGASASVEVTGYQHPAGTWTLHLLVNNWGPGTELDVVAGLAAITRLAAASEIETQAGADKKIHVLVGGGSWAGYPVAAAAVVPPSADISPVRYAVAEARAWTAEATP